MSQSLYFITKVASGVLSVVGLLSFSSVFLSAQENFFKGATSRITHLKKIGPIFSSLSFIIRLHLPQSEPSLFSFGLISLLWCFSTLRSYYFEVSFIVKVILPDQKNE